jgi:hypothetical protein
MAAAATSVQDDEVGGFVNEFPTRHANAPSQKALNEWDVILSAAKDLARSSGRLTETRAPALSCGVANSYHFPRFVAREGEEGGSGKRNRHGGRRYGNSTPAARVTDAA